MSLSRAVSRRKKPPRYRPNDLRSLCHLSDGPLNRSHTSLNHLKLVRPDLDLPRNCGGVIRGRQYRDQAILSTMQWSLSEARVNATLFFSPFPPQLLLLAGMMHWVHGFSFSSGSGVKL